MIESLSVHPSVCFRLAPPSHSVSHKQRVGSGRATCPASLRNVNIRPAGWFPLHMPWPSVFPPADGHEIRQLEATHLDSEILKMPSCSDIIRQYGGK